ncbi:hypothetical protein Tco_1419078 [Tanacetum coccineum]
MPYPHDPIVDNWIDLQVRSMMKSSKTEDWSLACLMIKELDDQAACKEEHMHVFEKSGRIQAESFQSLVKEDPRRFDEDNAKKQKLEDDVAIDTEILLDQEEPTKGRA